MRKNVAFLREFFRDRLILQGLWPLRCPDVTAPCLFLRNHLKWRVFGSSPRSIEEVKTSTEDAVSDIDHDFSSLALNVVIRVDVRTRERRDPFQRKL